MSSRRGADRSGAAVIAATLSSAIQKVGARNRMEAIRIAEEKGWLEP
jgi:DNA-binding NarL/FixJ family response regulator